MSLIRIFEGYNWIVDYNKESGMYRVSRFENGHFCDEIWFDCYKDKELSVEFPQTIGNITYYSKEELFNWIITQQELNKKYLKMVENQ